MKTLSNRFRPINLFRWSWAKIALLQKVTCVRHCLPVVMTGTTTPSMLFVKTSAKHFEAVVFRAADWHAYFKAQLVALSKNAFAAFSSNKTQSRIDWASVIHDCQERLSHKWCAYYGRCARCCGRVIWGIGGDKTETRDGGVIQEQEGRLRKRPSVHATKHLPSLWFQSFFAGLSVLATQSVEVGWNRQK